MTRKTLPLGLLAAVLACAWRPAPLPLSDTIRVALGDGWATVPLPEMALGVSAYKGTLWAVGNNEMIADSTDAGRTWTVVHHYKPGEMLFSVSFLDDNDVIALGSGHACLRSKDGGKTWKEDHSLKNSFAASDFASPAHGVAASPNGWGVTMDAGKTWEMHGLPLPHDAMMKPLDVKSPLPKIPLLHNVNRRVLEVAALDANREAVLLASEVGSQPWAFTTDGGKTWSVSGLFAGFKVSSMRAADGKFWLYGTNSQGQPTVMTSADMNTWDNNPPLPALYTDCGHQGCRVPGGFVQLDQPATNLWQLPTELPGVAPADWAAGADSFCEIGNDKLMCAQLHATWTAPAATPALAEVDYRDLTPTRWNEVTQPQVTYDSMGTDTHDGVTQVRIVLGVNGIPESMQVLSGDWGDLAQNVATQLKTWHFQPVVVEGKPVEARVDIPYVLILDMNSRTNPSAPVSSHASCCR